MKRGKETAGDVPAVSSLIWSRSIFGRLLQPSFDCRPIMCSDALSNNPNGKQAAHRHGQREKEQRPHPAPRFAPSLMLGILLPAVPG
jgi:hypothetical protein